MKLLTVNSGSTSIKIDLVDGGRRTKTWTALADAAASDPDVDAVAHRFVHGGDRTAPAVVDDDLRAELHELGELDPLHLPPALEAMDQARAHWPRVPHVACFDTTFHTTIPQAGRRYALPLPWRDRVPVYGFHGLSHAWSASRLAVLAPDATRAVVAHLGGGSSLCALLDGHSCATTMGFSPLDGLVMASRAGHLDPGALLWLTRQPGLDVEDLLARRSGLVGLTGTGDMREVLGSADREDPSAKEALAIWERRLLTELGGCIAVLGGVDALVFTGGIGENAAGLVERVCRKLGWLGVRLAAAVGPAPDRDEYELTDVSSRVRVFVVKAAEHLMMAREVEQLLRH